MHYATAGSIDVQLLLIAVVHHDESPKRGIFGVLNFADRRSDLNHANFDTQLL